MDPLQRLMMECAYEAVADAGINPRQMRGRNTVVFTGSSFSETEKSLFVAADVKLQLRIYALKVSLPINNKELQKLIIFQIPI